MAAIFHIETVIPKNKYLQTDIAKFMIEQAQDRKAKQYLAGIYNDSGIKSRFSVLKDFNSSSDEKHLLTQNGKIGPATTGRRNEIFARESEKLIKELMEKTFSNFSAIKASEITHVITVSCTGFYNPGPDIQVIQALGLSGSTERYHLGFMGCYGAFPALKMAKQFCDLNPNANVLIICLELCTLHFQVNENLDNLLANSLFADGVASVIVSSRNPKDLPVLNLESFHSEIISQAEKEMAWTIGDFGFEMVLSKYIPKIIGSNLPSLLENIFKKLSLSIEQINTWAIHPGGKSILDKVENSLNLRPEQLESSRFVLEQFGNMSSASILFVLKDILLKGSQKSEKIFAMAFGPGLVVESAAISFN